MEYDDSFDVLKRLDYMSDELQFLQGQEKARREVRLAIETDRLLYKVSSQKPKQVTEKLKQDKQNKKS